MSAVTERGRQIKYRELNRITEPTQTHYLKRNWGGVIRWWVIRQLVKILSPIVFFCLRVLGPWVKIRIGIIPFHRVGHLSLDTELYLRKRADPLRRNHLLNIYLTGEPANRQLLTMIKRCIPVYEYRWLTHSHDIFYRCAKNFGLVIDFFPRYNEYYDFNEIPPQLSFTAHEEEKGEHLLNLMGIEPEVPFVCFHARDKAYLDAKHQPWDSNISWTYHDYRDCHIENFLPAAKCIASMGMFALRMGQVVEARLNKCFPNIIDYATQYRTDFGDIYLPAKCKFFLGSPSGISSLPYIFNRPSVFVNWIPLGLAVPLLKSDLFIIKKLWDKKAKRFLSFREIIHTEVGKWQSSYQYEKAGIEVIENSAEEILAVAKEMNSRLDGTWTSSKEDEELQNLFRGLFPPGHPCHGFPSRMGAEFLRQNRSLLD